MKRFAHYFAENLGVLGTNVLGGDLHYPINGNYIIIIIIIVINSFEKPQFIEQ